ncbi:MAG: ABC transporter ATP-binding protein, partial [Pseudomonadota bacterium]
MAEGIGLASLLPLLAIATGEEGEEASPFFTAIRNVFENLGLPLEIGPLLLLVLVAIVMKAALTMAALFYIGRAVAEITTRLR